MLQEQRADIQMLHNVVNQQATRLSYQTTLSKDYIKRIKVLEMKLAVQHKDKPGSKEITNDVDQTEALPTQTSENNFKQELQSVSVSDNEAAKQRKEKIRNNRAAENPVAFQALFRGDGQKNIGRNQNIVFPDVVTNLGSGYHNHQGVFIAPIGGVYIFSTSIGAERDSYIDVKIMVNGNRLASVMSVGNTAARYGQGTVTVVSQLAANDEVWVSLFTPEGSSLHGAYFSSFMGCLVYPFDI